MAESLCETCARMREVLTPRGSRFLLRRLAAEDPADPKYAPADRQAFQDSEVAADTIGTVTLSVLDTGNAGTAFGIKEHTAGAVVVAKAAEPASRRIC